MDGDRRRGGSGGDQSGIEDRFRVLVGVAVGYEIQKNMEVLQTQQCHGFGVIGSIVGGVVALLANKVHPLPEVGADDGTEFLPVHEALEVVLERHVQLLVHGVHPLHSKLHGTAAVEDTSRRIKMENLLRRHRRIRKGRKGRVREEEFEVGHGLSPHRIKLCSKQFLISYL